MRLIDADTLLKKVEKILPWAPYPSEYAQGIRYCMELMTVIIKDAPTIEPERKKGKWQITDAYPHNVYCSECHKRFAQTHWAVWEDGTLPRDFCPSCGADMREEHDIK